MVDESSHSGTMILPVDEQRPIDKNWFETTYHAHAPMVLVFVKSRVRSHAVAEDIAQQVWLKVWSQANARFDGKNFRGWILQIAKNQIIDTFRAKRPLPSSDKIEAAVAATDVRDDELRERADALRECLNGISSELATVIRARLLGKPYDEIASELEIPLGTAHSRFSKAKDQLRRCVEGRIG